VVCPYFLCLLVHILPINLVILILEFGLRVVTSHFNNMKFRLKLKLLKGRLNLNSINQLIFVMVKCGVLFEVRTEFLNNI
jgi:hypothetical protein